MTEWEGKDRRVSSTLSSEDKQFLASIVSGKSDEKKFFGFKLQDIVIIATILFSILAFYWRTDDAMNRLIALTDYLIKYANNSDNYHSAKFGVEFQQGKPLYNLNRGSLRDGSNENSSH